MAPAGCRRTRPSPAPAVGAPRLPAAAAVGLLAAVAPPLAAASEWICEERECEHSRCFSTTSCSDCGATQGPGWRDAGGTRKCGPWYRCCETRPCARWCQCAADCGVGRFRQGCGGHSHGECANCSGLPEHADWTAGGGLLDECPWACRRSFYRANSTGCAPCPRCPAGQYRLGCGDGQSGSCVGCTTSLPPGAAYTTDGGVEDACEWECDASHRSDGNGGCEALPPPSPPPHPPPLPPSPPPPPPPPTYACNGTRCVLTQGGPFLSGDCGDHCRFLVPPPPPTPPSPPPPQPPLPPPPRPPPEPAPPPPPPSPVLYGCDGTRCVPSAGGAGAPPGRFLSASCEGYCLLLVPPPPPRPPSPPPLPPPPHPAPPPPPEPPQRGGAPEESSGSLARGAAIGAAVLACSAAVVFVVAKRRYNWLVYRRHAGEGPIHETLPRGMEMGNVSFDLGVPPGQSSELSEAGNAEGGGQGDDCGCSAGEGPEPAISPPRGAGYAPQDQE